MSFDKKMLTAAAEAAGRNSSRGRDPRGFLIGAVGVRADGVIVASKNVAATDLAPNHHAEARLSRKLTPNSTVWVARILRASDDWAMARPCQGCQNRMRSVGVRRVVYTIGPDEWGVLDLTGDQK